MSRSICYRILIFSCLMIMAALAGSPSRLEAQNQVRDVAKFGDFHLSASMVNQNVWMFEISQNEIAPATPLDSSSLVSEQIKIAKPSGSAGNWRGGSSETRLSQNPPSLIISEKRGEQTKRILTVTPYAPDGALNGISFTGDYSHLMGLGTDFRNFPTQLNLSGKTLMPGGPYGNSRIQVIDHQPTQVQIPLLYALGQGFDSMALFVDDPRPLIWNLKDAPWTVSLAGPLGAKESVRFFVIMGPNMQALRREFMNLTGRPPVPPINALGVWASGVTVDQESHWLDKIGELKKEAPGLSGLLLPAPESKEALKAPLEAAEAHKLTLMVDESAYLPANSVNFAELAKRGYLVKQGNREAAPMTVSQEGRSGGLIDYTNEAVGTFWHSLLRDSLVASGITNFRLTDADLPNIHPDAYYNGSPDAGSHSHYAWANRYALRWIASLTNGVNNQRLRQRPRIFALSSSGTAGLGSFGGGLYNGNSFLFSTKALMAAKAHLALAGIDYYSSDLSALLISRPHAQFSTSYDAWVAKSSLLDLPLVMPETLLNQPGAKYNLTLRERLRPYYYSLAWLAWLEGSPVIAPLAFYYQDDPGARDRSEELMIGPYLLVGLNVEPNMERSQVYVPKGRWYNWHTGEVINQEEAGLVSMDVKTGPNLRPPILAKAGAIIPAFEEVTQANGPPLKIKALKLFIGQESSSFTWYEDDGHSVGYRNGEAGHTMITAVTNPDGSTMVTIKARNGQWPGAPETRQLLVDIYGPKAPGEATLNKLPHNRVAHAAELDQRESGWASSGSNRIRFKTPPLPVNQDHVLWFK